MGQGMNAATTNPEDFFPSATGLLDLFR